MNNLAQNAPEGSTCRYWAFISYSNKDRKWARWLHRSIEAYGIPAQLVSHPTPIGEPAPKRFRPLFHDRAELPASSDLGSQIEVALRESRYLIVVCSPHSAQSKWVNKEIEIFQRFHGRERILAIIVDGEPNDGEEECFPLALRYNEPIAADARPEADGTSNAKLKLLAGMLGVTFDALKQRDNQRRIRQLKMVLALVTLLVAAFATLSLYANHQRLLAIDALASSDFREGISRLRLSETTPEGIALLARAARRGSHQERALVRLLSLFQQRQFWVEAPPLSSLPLNSSSEKSLAIDRRFAEVKFQGIAMKPDWFSRSNDGKTCVTIINEEIDIGPHSLGFRIHHFRVWHSDGTPITPWTLVKCPDFDVRDLVSAHLSADGQFVAIVVDVWREPQVIQIWDVRLLTVVGDIIVAGGRDPNYQGSRFTQVRFLPPVPREPKRLLLLATTSRGDATVYELRRNTIEVVTFPM
ncbi:MAG TPA: TIR domain-containing protein [Tepidisphaeraceae bacterium]|jgi:hypothetical protein|nr:TIR domain-containing protein [Tepidisphaeraceae bacterium]